MKLNIINELLLDEKNPRFGNIEGQSEILKFFSKDEKLRKLASDIAENGLSPIELPIVLDNKNGTYTVLEGNRRIASIKLMHSPEAAETDTASKFFKKIGRSKKVPEVIDCHVVTNREEAFDWINRRHSCTNTVFT